VQEKYKTIFSPKIYPRLFHSVNTEFHMLYSNLFQIQIITNLFTCPVDATCPATLMLIGNRGSWCLFKQNQQQLQ